MKLQNKVVLITGAAQGIGWGCARVCAKHGAQVVVVDLADDAGRRAVGELKSLGATAEFIQADMTDEAAVQSAIDHAVAQFGGLDALVNNVGWHPAATNIEQTTVADFEKLLRLNLTSTFIACKYAVPYLKKSKGSIVTISSEAALLGQGDACSYVASKAGQLGLTRALAIDLAPSGVRVNAICPAGVMTPLMREWASTQYDPQAALATVDDWHLLGRMAQIDEIGEVCAFLLSAEASFITGQDICPDGGAALGYRRG